MGDARRWQILSAILAVLLVFTFVSTRLKQPPANEIPKPPPSVEAPPEPLPDELLLQPADWTDLPGWLEDPLHEALPALRRSCSTLTRDRRQYADTVAGPAELWEPICEALAALGPEDSAGLRAWTQTHLRPWSVTNRGEPEGLFTGYYEPTLHGSRAQQGPYRAPLHLAPPELIGVDLGAFRPDLAGTRIAGKLVDGRLVPLPSRREIDGGALNGRDLELVWVDDPVDAFFLHVQGSGVVELDDGGEMRVGYAAQNGHPYTSIGRKLVDLQELTLEEVSMQTIRAWLDAHPEQRDEILHANASYVFFRELKGEGPLGSLGVALTPGRSLAVDRRFLPLGPPLWLETEAPTPFAEGTDPVRRLVTAQDTGGAIRGPVRGDLFWGHGDEAAEIAGRMKHSGRLWLLLPRDLDPSSPVNAP